MTREPLISHEVFDYLRNLGIEPYTKLHELARDQLGDGLRLLACLSGDVFITQQPGLRVSVLSGKVRLEPAGTTLDLATTRERPVLTQAGENRLVADTDAVILLADAAFLDTLSSWAELTAYADQSGDQELLDRLLAVRHSLAFQRVPLEQVMQALRLMQPRAVKAGEAIVSQGDRGDAFYLIRGGRAEVWQSDPFDDTDNLVATIGPGDTFGDEALVTGGTRNATVRMVEDGELLVLGADAFRDLLSRPLIDEVTTSETQALMANGWKALDVRYDEEFEDGHVPDAIHLPLHELRQRADTVLDRNHRYVTICLSGKRSAVAAFLLKQRGYDVRTMKGGMSAWEGETVC